MNGTMVSIKGTIRMVTVAALTCAAALAHAQEGYTPKNGDLLFQEGNTGDFEAAIKAVTPSYKGRQLTHVGAVYISNGEVKVVEALPKGVVVTPYSDFLNRELDELGRPRVFVGRVKPQLKVAVDEAVLRMVKLVGKKYDPLFDIDNDSYYCSEIVYKCYTDNSNRPIFTLKPMTFNDPNTGLVFEKWRTYFENLKSPIPEGKPGLNPGGMANESVVDIIYSFYSDLK